jgi:rifampicin phosphotransferase
LSAAVLESASAGVASESATTPGLALGTRVSGSKVVVGRACVIPEDDSELGKSLAHFRDGDIIVAAMINPAWLPYFSRAGGFVSEVGGWLSHPAILAREYDVAMIVGTEGISGIEDGTLLKLHQDGRIETLIEEPMASQVAAE